jgi:hypothetical protein
VIVTGANRHDVTQPPPLIDVIPPIRGKRDRPLSKPAIVQGQRDDSRPILKVLPVWKECFSRPPVDGMFAQTEHSC